MCRHRGMTGRCPQGVSTVCVWEVCFTLWLIFWENVEEMSVVLATHVEGLLKGGAYCRAAVTKVCGHREAGVIIENG